MRRRPQVALIILAIASVLSSSASAQLVSAQCCTVDADLDAVSGCYSGDGNTTRPEGCARGATCVLGFAAPDAQSEMLRDRLCDPAVVEIPVFTQGFCSAWQAEDAEVSLWCVAKKEFSADIFATMDDDGDGDLDETDLALFEEVRTVVPKLVQSPAVLTGVECCAPPDEYRLSGPGVPAEPLVAHCVVEFSDEVVLGDYLFNLCSETSEGPYVPLNSLCTSWRFSDAASTFSCPATAAYAQAFAIVCDLSGDGDADLRDFAIYQRFRFDWADRLPELCPVN